MITKEQFLALALPYNTVTNVYQDPYQIQWARFLNGFLIHNTGNTIVLFNGDQIQPGESKSIGGNYGEIYVGRLSVRFITPTPPPVPVINEVIIDQKFYVFD